MSRRQVWWSVFGFAATIALSPVVPRDASLSAQTVVIRRVDIERAGWNRVSEILDGAVGWARISVDAFSFAASPDHLPAAGESAPSMPEWIVVVNGQRVPTTLLGAHLLELLPISVGQIDSVVFTRGPSIYDGAPVARGVMSIFSRRPRHGVNGELTYQHGDESGDPGPYRYTDLASPNLEKIGPFAHGDIGWASPTWDVDAGVHIASLNITDTLITSRFSPSTFARLRPDVVSITPTFHAAVDALGGRHEIFASYGDQRGLLFVPTQRSEQSLKTKSAYVGLDGTLNVAASTFSYERSTSSIDASELASPLAFTVGHTRRHLGGTVSASHNVGRATLTMGAIGDRWTLTTGPLSTSSSGGGPLVRAVVPIGGATTVDGSATLIFDGARGASLDGSIATSFRMDSVTSVTIRGSRVQSHPNMDGTWIDAFMTGYQLPATAPTFSVGGVALAHRFLPFVAATIELRAERVTDWAGLGAPNAAPLSSSQDPLLHHGAFLGAHGRIETLGESVWQGSLEYDRTSASNLDGAAFGAELASTPVNDFRAQLSATPVRDFRLSGIASLASGTSWSTFGDGQAPATLPPRRRVDASMEKWMWQRRLRFELVYRNLLNEPERYHPFGAQWNLRWHVSASLIF
ncbi:MAG: hypothetical protein ACM3SX_10205 [Deltaproteobacteria bacterium]